jgi:hypothetical protein
MTLGVYLLDPTFNLEQQQEANKHSTLGFRERRRLKHSVYLDNGTCAVMTFARRSLLCDALPWDRDEDMQRRRATGEQEAIVRCGLSIFVP